MKCLKFVWKSLEMLLTVGVGGGGRGGVNPINMVYNFQMKEIGPPGTRWKLGMRVFKKKQRSMGSHKKVTIFADTTYTCMMMALRAGGVI